MSHPIYKYRVIVPDNQYGILYTFDNPLKDSTCYPCLEERLGKATIHRVYGKNISILGSPEPLTVLPQ